MKRAEATFITSSVDNSFRSPSTECLIDFLFNPLQLGMWLFGIPDDAKDAGRASPYGCITDEISDIKKFSRSVSIGVGLFCSSFMGTQLPDKTQESSLWRAFSG